MQIHFRFYIVNVRIFLVHSTTASINKVKSANFMGLCFGTLGVCTQTENSRTWCSKATVFLCSSRNTGNWRSEKVAHTISREICCMGIGGSRGCRVRPLLLAQLSFVSFNVFMQFFSAKIGQIINRLAPFPAPFRVCAHVWEILDPPLNYRLHCLHLKISFEVGHRNSAQTGQLNPLFHTSTELVNRVGLRQNTD